MDQNKPESKNDKRIIIACATGMLVCLCVLFFGDRFIWNNNGLLSDKPKIGTITLQQNDARRKSAGSFVWYKAKDRDIVQMGDAVFSGANSTLRVELQKGGGVDIGENSLVLFDEIENQNVANLAGGNFRLKVEGQMKIAIAGQVTTFESKGAEVQVFFIKDKKPRLRVIQGKVEVKNKLGQVARFDQRNIASLVPLDPAKEERSTPAKTIEIPMPVESKIEYYTWHLYDLYKQMGPSLLQREDRPAIVKAKTELKWAPTQAKRALLQVSQSEGFQTKADLVSDAGSKQLEALYIGDNFWRVSVDEGKNWSVAQKLRLEPRFLENVQAILPRPEQEVILLDSSVSVDLDIQVPVMAVGYVAEASLTPNFLPESTRIFWSPTIQPKLSFYRPGSYYYRFRVVTKDQELSDWSATQVYHVVRPKIPNAPILAKQSAREFTLGQFVNLTWQSDSVQTITEFFDEKGRKIYEQKGQHLSWTAPKEGIYRVRAYALDKYNRPSPSSKVAVLKVLPKPSPKLRSLPMKLAQEKSLPRQPTSVESTNAMKLSDIKALEPSNQKYRSSQLSAQGFLWTLQSSQQYYQGKENPVATGLGLHGITWWDQVGLQGSFKSGVLAANKEGAQTSMKDIEARVHYRFLTRFPFGLARELQTTVFGGYEIHRNSGDLFANQYDLVKFGTSLEFPLLNRWSAGGEFVYGLGPDGSNKQEVSGNLNYFISRDWSLGIGYRINHFTAGSEASAPGGYLPYKEGYTEGYSILNFHF